MGEELLEAEAIEEAVVQGPEDEVDATRRLPEPARRSDVSIWREDVRSAAIAAAGGLVVGAATVAAVRATRAAAQPRRRVSRRSRERMPGIVASRSFLIDVHLLDRS